MRAHSMEFGELNVEYGYAYESAAVVDDGSPAPEPVDDVRIYEPSTRPGSPLPHAWIDDEDGERRPIKDLVAPGPIPADRRARRATRGARPPASSPPTGLPLDAVRIGHVDGDLFDPRCTWLRHREIGRDGAILVRPDRVRRLAAAPTAADDPRAALAGALGQMLARPIDAPVPSVA